MTKRTAFVTGATGVLGLNLVERLLAAGWDVTALHRKTSDLRYLKRLDARMVVGSIEDRDSLLQVVPQNIDALFHTAADVSFWSKDAERQKKTNIEGVRNVVDACMQRGVKRLIHTSTMGVYGLRAAPFDETAEKLGRHSWIHYFQTKAMGEEIVREGIAKGLQAVILNPSNMTGPYDASNWGRIFMELAKRRRIYAPYGKASYCHAVEVAKAHIAAVDKGRVGENYLLGGAEGSYLRVFKLIASLVPNAKTPIWISRLNFRIYARVATAYATLKGTKPDVTIETARLFSGDQVIHSDKAEKELGYSPTGLEKMFEDCYRWHVAEGLLKG